MDTKETRLFQKIKNYDKLLVIFILSVIIYIVAALNNNSFLNIMPLKDYLTWHTILEFASILVSLSIFTVTYFIYEESSNFQMIVFGCVFLLMGLLDFFHTFSFKGMPHFFIANHTANRATTLFILSRFIGSLGFFVAISIPSKLICNIRKEIFAVVITLFTTVLFLVVTYYPELLPPMYIEGEGLTTLKILLEYFIILTLAVSFIKISAQYKQNQADRELNLMIALLLLMFSEFAFTNYGHVYDAFNYIGHVYKVIAFSILYKSIYIENLSIPFKEMKIAKNKLKRYSANLNVIVRQRTKELEDLNKILLDDIEYAKEMQRCLLPAYMPKDMSVSFDAVYLAAEKLSGDFYNVVKLDENNIAVYIGDVSGHGISAAMLTVFAYQNVIQLKEKEDSKDDIIEPTVVLETIYKSFNKTNMNDEKYIVMLYGIYNIKERTFNYASAGINVPPYIIKNSGDIYEMDSKGFPICKLGDFITPTYKNKTINLDTGDKIIFYSDGLVDAKNKNNEIYGQQRLKDLLKNNHNLNSVELNIAIKNDLFKHIGYAGSNSLLMDDVTFLNMMILE